jgi:hypothetical protein
MALPVKLQDVIEAMDITGEEHSQYLDRRAGEVFMVTNEEMEAAEEDELISEYPDWQREGILKARETLNSNDFVELPTQFDITSISFTGTAGASPAFLECHVVPIVRFGRNLS